MDLLQEELSAAELKEYKGFRGTIVYDDQQDLFYGKIVGAALKPIAYWTSFTLGEAQESFESAVDSYLTAIGNWVRENFASAEKKLEECVSALGKEKCSRSQYVQWVAVSTHYAGRLAVLQEFAKEFLNFEL